MTFELSAVFLAIISISLSSRAKADIIRIPDNSPSLRVAMRTCPPERQSSNSLWIFQHFFEFFLSFLVCCSHLQVVARTDGKHIPAPGISLTIDKVVSSQHSTLVDCWLQSSAERTHQRGRSWCASRRPHDFLRGSLCPSRTQLISALRPFPFSNDE